MRGKTSTVALCGVAGALAAVLMLVGGLIGIGTYASPMLAGAALIPVGYKAGRRAQLWAFLCVSAVCVFIVGDWEQNLMFMGFFGWYPMVRPALQKCKKARFLWKALVFNLPVAAVECLAMTVLGQETETAAMLIALWLCFNLLFILYDRLLPRMEILMVRRLRLGPPSEEHHAKQ